jgi:D-alanine-D-alanine ligase
VVAVVCGGPSQEAEVSRESGRCVAEALRSTYGTVVLLELNEGIPQTLREARCEVVFPALHGPPGEDGTFQGFLEILGLPYVGSGVASSALAMNKAAAKRVFAAHGLAVAKDVLIERREGVAEAVRRALSHLGPDLVIKPVSRGSALGVCFARGRGEAEEAVGRAFLSQERLLVEERVRGKEVTVAVLEREGVEALPPIEVCTPPGSWYDYKHRYTPGLSTHVIPAALEPAQLAGVCEAACRAHLALDCRDLSRADFIVPDGGAPVLLEVNTLPGMTPTSLFPDAARVAGLGFPALTALLVERAWARRGRPSG